ncbi:MAG: hypothetical protein ACRDSZ_18930 [Pseudonocardiaceae bacterium]
MTRLHWARGADELLHLVDPAEVAAATILGAVEALCGLRLDVAALVIDAGSTATCSACLAGVTDNEPSTQWAQSPYDFMAHALCDPPRSEATTCGHPPAEVGARCGAGLPRSATVGAAPRWRRCARCDLLDLAAEYAPGGP